MFFSVSAIHLSFAVEKTVFLQDIQGRSCFTLRGTRLSAATGKTRNKFTGPVFVFKGAASLGGEAFLKLLAQ